MTNEQIVMVVILVGVGGAFLLGFLLIRRWLDARETRMAHRLGGEGVQVNLAGEARTSLLTGHRRAGDSGIGLAGSDPKLKNSGMKASGGSGSGGAQGDSRKNNGAATSGTSGASAGRGGAPLAGSLVLDEAALQQPRGVAARLDRGFNRMVTRSGLSWTPEQALGMICLGGVLFGGALYLWKEELWVSIVGMVIGVAIPLGVLMYLQSRWQKLLQEQMPDAFFFLARSLRAGLSLEQALAVSGAQGAKPLADELRRCSERVRLGLPIPTALELTAKRINLLDFNVFVSIVALHQTTGGNLALQLDRLASSVRDRNQYQGYFRSATALGRISAIAIGGAVPVIFLGYALFQPEFALRFFESAAGLTMLGVAFGLEIIGAIWLYVLLKVNY